MEAGPPKAADQISQITALRPCCTQVRRQGTSHGVPLREDQYCEEQPCLSFLGQRNLSAAFGHLRLTDRDKLNCMLLGITECLEKCDNLLVELQELPTREQQTLEGETSREFLQGSYLKVSTEDSGTFQTSLMEGVASRFGIKPTRRMSLKQWLCMVVRVLRANEVDITKCEYLMVAKDLHYMVTVGCPLYNKLKLSVVPMRAGLTMYEPIRPSPLTVMDDEVQLLQQKLAELVEKRDRAQLLAGDSDGQ